MNVGARSPLVPSFLCWFLLSGCGPFPGPPQPDWYPLAPCTHCYHGEGIAKDYNTALRRAKAALCEDIAVVVTSTSRDMRTSLLRETADGHRVATFEELVTVAARTKARCVLPGLPLLEKRDEAGGNNYVVLRMEVAAWKKFLDQRATYIKIESAAGQPLRGVRNVLANYLRYKAYPVATVEDRANMGALVRFESSVGETPDDFQGLHVGTGKLTYSLVRLTGGDEVESFHISDVTARAFKPSVVLQKLEDTAIDKMKEVLLKMKDKLDG
jgi:hypothetical protein